MEGREKYAIHYLDGQTACIWGTGGAHKTNSAKKRCSCVAQGLSFTDGCRCSDICQNTNQRESLSERDDEEED